MHIEKQNMNVLFNPKSVAVIGASEKEDKLGFHVMKSLNLGGFPGRIIPINPGLKEIMGIKTFPSISEFLYEIDLAIVVLPAKMVPTILEECLAKGVKAIVLITAGFKEIDDPVGEELHQKIARLVNKQYIPIIGPNTFGMINLHANLNASFTPEFSLLQKGSIGLISQSGGMCHLISFLALRNGVGFSKIVGIGNRLNVDFAQMVDYLMQDPETNVIAMYMEGIDNPKELMDVAKTYGSKKPIVVYKTGLGNLGDKASHSHTGSIAGRREIYEGAFSQAGILTVNNAEELLDTAKALGVVPLPDTPSVAILSSQAGPGIAAADLCQMSNLKIVSFHRETQNKINELLPPLALRTNPVDMGPAWYNSEALVGIIDAVMRDKNIGGILLFMMFASANIDSIKSLSFLINNEKLKKSLITCFSAPPGIWDEHIKQFEHSNILVNYPTPERAARVMINLNRYRDIGIHD
jgi:acyl-CoA synthetase (NDP forming)